MPAFTFEKEYIQLDLFDDPIDQDRFLIVEEYVSQLNSSKVPVIFDTGHFARLVGYSDHFLHSVSASPESFYREYRIAKKSGGIRVINEPLPTLKIIQRFIIDHVIQNVEPHKVARAYRKNHTLRGAALIHKGRPFMLKLDIEDFFPSIRDYFIFRIFFDLGYTRQISALLSGLCTLNRGLPQGSPSSPMLSNILLRSFDTEVFDYCVENGIYYTRYADDLTFSAMDERLIPLIPMVRDKLKRFDLKINDRKTSYAAKGARKYVNGIVVNERLNILKSLRSEIRQDMYYIRKYGINGHIRAAKITKPNYIDTLIGKINYAYFVTKEKKFLSHITYLKEIKKVL